MWSPDDPLTLAAAGSHGKLQIWDIGANAGVRKTLGSKVAQAGKILKEKESSGGVIGVVSDDEESGEDDG
jgi:periodic tryptophan protein 1